MMKRKHLTTSLLLSFAITATSSSSALAEDKKTKTKPKAADSADKSSVPVKHHHEHHAGAYDVLILGGGKTQGEAEKVAKRANTRVYAIKWAIKGDYARYDPVRVVKSDTVAGLNPGFFIAVAGFCSHEKYDAGQREDALKAMRKLEAGAYVRHVHEDPHSISCPDLWTSSLYPDLEERKLRARIDNAEKAGGKRLVKALVDYANYLKLAGRLLEAEVFVGAALKIDPDDKAANDLGKIIMVLLTD